MSSYGSIRTQPVANDTSHYLVSIAPDFAPQNYAEAATHRSAPSRDAEYWGGRNCTHADSSFWFWMWAFSSGNRPIVHHHHHYAPMGRAATHGVSHAHAFSGVSPSHQGGMSGGESVGYAVAGTALAAGALAAHSYFNDKHEAASEKLEAARSMRAKWEKVTPRPQDKKVYDSLMRVLQAQEKVEAGRTLRASIYKWSVVVIGLAGVALVIGALVNIWPVVLAGVVVAVAAGVFAGVTALIASCTDDAAACKKVGNDYQLVSRHFLLPPEAEAPFPYREREESRGAPQGQTERRVERESVPTAPSLEEDAELEEYEQRTEQWAQASREAARAGLRRRQAVAWREKAGERVDSERRIRFSPSFERLEERMRVLHERELAGTKQRLR